MASINSVSQSKELVRKLLRGQLGLSASEVLRSRLVCFLSDGTIRSTPIFTNYLYRGTQAIACLSKGTTDQGKTRRYQHSQRADGDWARRPTENWQDCARIDQ